MSDHAPIQELLDRVRRRATGLWLLRAVAGFAALFLLASLACAAVAASGAVWSRPLFAAALLFALGAVILRYGLPPLGLPQLADAVARAAPELRSDLVSSVELTHEEALSLGASSALVAALVRSTGERASKVDVSRAVPLSDARREGQAVLAAAGLVLVAALLAPHRLWSGFLALVAPGNAAAAVLQVEPIAGDLVLTYRYPVHTALPSRTEQSVAGDIRAPRGTYVDLTARADRDVVQAVAVVSGKTVPLTVTAGRKLSGTLLVDTPGDWRLRFADARGRVVAEGPPRGVAVEPDNPPEVRVLKPTQQELEVDPHGKVLVEYVASDDYGLGELTLVWRNLTGGVEQRKALPKPGVGEKSVKGALAWELSPLGLAAGDKLAWFVEALDNDAVSGPKKGVSATHVLKVYSASEHHKEALARVQALWERLVTLAADRLEEPAPSAPGELLETWYAKGTAVDRGAVGLSGELRKAAHDLSKDRGTPKGLPRALDNVAAGVGTSAQRTTIARSPLAKAVGSSQAERTFLIAREGEAREEEKDILYLEDLFDKTRLADLVDLARQLKAERRELSRLAEELRGAKDPQAKQQALEQVARLKARVKELMAQMQALAKGIRDEHLNEEAMNELAKDQDMEAKLDDIEKMLAKGDVDAALKELDKLGQQLDDLEKSLAEKGGDALDDKYKEQAEKLSQLKDDLTALQEEESRLKDQTQQLRQGARAEQEKKLKALGADFFPKLQKKVAEAKKSLEKIDPDLAEQLGLDDERMSASERLDTLDKALGAKDVDEALDASKRALQPAASLRARLEAERQMAQRRPSWVRDPQALEKAANDSDEVEQPVREVQRQLEKLMPQPGQEMSPQDAAKLSELSGRQGSLGKRMDDVRKRMEEVGKDVPIFTPQHEQLLKDARGAMGEAEQKLSQKDARGGQSSEQDALDKMQRFQESMEKQAQNGKGGKGGFPMPWGRPRGDPGDEGDDSGDDDNREKVEIPAADSRGPAEYRKDILDAARQPAPEKFKDRVKQYYEELVK